MMFKNLVKALAFRDWPSFRQWVQVVAAAAVYALVTYNVVPNAAVDEILALVAACLPPALSIFNSPSATRNFIYGAVVALQAVILVLRIADVAHIDAVFNVVLAMIGAGTAVTHTPTPNAAAKHEPGPGPLADRA